MKGLVSRGNKPSWRKKSASVILIIILTFLGGCSFLSSKGTGKQAGQASPSTKGTEKPAEKSGIPNAATINCINKGKTLVIQNRGDGEEYGVCIFGDNLQCEEWALYRKECPDGGAKITDQMTPAARYCVVTGGVYKAAARDSNKYYAFIRRYLLPVKEEGTCTFKNYTYCDAWDYFDGFCIRVSNRR